jgi:hypothetical protein
MEAQPCGDANSSELVGFCWRSTQALPIQVKLEDEVAMGAGSNVYDIFPLLQLHPSVIVS